MGNDGQVEGLEFVNSSREDVKRASPRTKPNSLPVADQRPSSERAIDAEFEALAELDGDLFSRRARGVLKLFAYGVTLALAVAVTSNYPAWLSTLATTAPGPRLGLLGKFNWDFDAYELSSGEAAVVVLGLGAIVATLNVAVVASAWRPVGLNMDVERSVEQ